MEKDIRKFGVDDADEYWVERQKAGRVSERRLHRFLCNLVDEIAPEGSQVLDCGMGSGHFYRLCMDRHHTYGIDMSPKAIEMCGFPPETVRQANLNREFPDFGVRFDVILASMLLHWLDDPAGFLLRAKEKLSPTGRLIVVIPNITFYRFRLAFLFGKFPPISASHKNFQVPGEVEEMFRKVGLTMEKRLSPRKSLRAALSPKLFSPDIVYVLKPA